MEISSLKGLPIDTKMYDTVLQLTNMNIQSSIGTCLCFYNNEIYQAFCVELFVTKLNNDVGREMA